MYVPDSTLIILPLLYLTAVAATLASLFFEKVFCCCCSCWNSAGQHVGVYDPQHPDKEYKLEDGEVVEVIESDSEIEDVETVSVVIHPQEDPKAPEEFSDVTELGPEEIQENINEKAKDNVLDVATSVTLSSDSATISEDAVSFDDKEENGDIKLKVINLDKSSQ